MKSIVQFIVCAVATACIALCLGCDHKSQTALDSPAPESAAADAILTGKVDYGRDVQPILSNYCYHCHGPDTASREAGLRLDLREKALHFKNDDGKFAIVPGKPEQSELVSRVESHDAEERMPQDKEKLLNPAQIKLLRDWITQGAEFRDHWAFEKPVKAPLPETKNKTWSKNAVDAFVLAKLESENMRPNPEADKPALIRRVTLDLTGLLPTPTEVSAFVADTAPDAYEKVVNRLLDNTRYGEHRSRYWLDYARYADTMGLHNDFLQGRWPYRDYVIKAFNEDKPFDTFTREQLAGDLLPAENVDQLVASGFIRNGVSTGEGGTLLEELRVNNARERTEAFGATFMGLTTGCAMCHDHKYDPISHKDAYALTAFFNNIEEIASSEDRYDWPPSIKVPKPQNRAAYDKTLAQKAVLEKQITVRQDALESEITKWRGGGGQAQMVAEDGLVLHLRLDENHPDDAAPPTSFLNSAPGAAPAPLATAGPTPFWGEDTHLWPSFRLAPNTKMNLGGLGDFATTQPFSAGGWFKPKQASFNNNGTSATGALIAKMDGASPYRGWNLLFDNGVATVQIISTWPADALSVSTPTGVMGRGQWTHVFFTYDGSGKAAGVKLYVNGVEQLLKTNTDTLNGSIQTQSPLWLGRRNPDAAILQEVGFQDLRLYQRALSADEVARLPYEEATAAILAAKEPAMWSGDERNIVSHFYFSRVDDSIKTLRAQVVSLDAQLAALSKDGDITLISREADSLPYADILSRGGFASRIGRVSPDTPHFLPPIPKGEPHNRKGLAEWVLSEDNPLTARVTVNRMWQELYGIGLVESSEDFGIVGDRPTNQALLDFLAVDFMENKWQIKRIYKLLVMSATYRQSAQAAGESAFSDPMNRHLVRGPRYRMDAEMIRDTALQASVLLVEKIGGPSVNPYQPPGIWEAGGQTISNTTYYKQDHGENLYRRSMYTIWKRMAMMPDMQAFDAPSRDIVCVRRQRTNTPLAALVLFNNVQLLEAARFLGLRAIREGGATDEDKLNYLARITLTRPLEPEELAPLKESLAKFRIHFDAAPADATDLLTQGEKPKPTDIPDVEQAAWMMVGNQFFNFDAFLNK